MEMELSTNTVGNPGVMLGAYEKALRWTGDWDALFGQAAAAGFSFVDLSLDETPARLARLDWTARERARVRAAATRSGIMIGGLCLSAHRAIGPGSIDPSVRGEATRILLDAIDLCADLDIPLLQIAGYYAFYEGAAAGARGRYIDVLRIGADHAALRGVMLGIENVDGADITSISAALEICDEVGSAYLELYPDIGNFIVQGLDAVAELAAGRGRMLAIHAKDTRPGTPRRVSMGDGEVRWDVAFAELKRQNWSGRMLIEMWNDSRPDSARIAAEARQFIEDRLTGAGLRVHRPGDPARTRP